MLRLVSAATDTERVPPLRLLQEPAHVFPLPIVAPETNFAAFLQETLQDPVARAAYEDAQSRHGLVDLLVRCRQRLGLTQTAVARKMGVKQPAVSGFETEGSDPRLATLQRYARAVNARLRFSVQSNHTFARVDFYYQDHAPSVDYVEHAEATCRAQAWAQGSSTGYPRAPRHLALVS